ncbi:MAG: tetratricopeptide repeat protein [Myxococcales bacterium]|nr:tetratricopeptide repeat protein [Myxococcales bacterium]
MSAIERFERFISRYPDDPRYTPDALFRLAELHFEKSNEAYLAALEKAEAETILYDQGKTNVLPEQPSHDYSRTIELFDRLIGAWPNYRNVDGAIYLKGYCLLEMGNEKPALEQFLALVERFPQSQFAAETWTRIGEFYFDNNELEKAIGAYSKVLGFEGSPYYDKALYKLAWTFYRNDQFVDAIGRFRELIEYSDAQAKKTGRAGSDLRSEAIQYLAISLQEEDWDGDTAPDPDAGFARVLRYVSGEKPYDVEVLRAVAGIFFDNAKYSEAVATIRHLLAKFPNHPENPELHFRMIQAYERDQRRAEAFAERSALSTAYGEGSAWHEANKDDPKVLAAADELAEEMLIQAAQYHHGRAQDLKKRLAEDPSLEQEAVGEYGKAAGAYEKYLARYPDSERAYDLNFFYAECLYYSFNFPVAATQYASVRDSDKGAKYRELSAFSAILARQNLIRQLIQDGRLEPKPSLLDQAAEPAESQAANEDDTEKRVIEPLKIPVEVEQLLTDRKVYVDKGLNSSEDKDRQARIIYKIGEVYFDYRDFEQSREWLRKLISRYPKTDVAAFAARIMVETYRQANDWQGMADVAKELEKFDLGKELGDEILTLKTGAIFKSAEKLFADEKFDEAAAEYVRLLKENPGTKFADAALNNAAVAYEKTRRFESATRMYQRLVDEHPKSPYAENALFRVAVNAERFYDFDRAIENHLKLVGSFEGSSHRADSLYQAALLQERLQRYGDAARNYERYASLFPERSDTAETFYRAGGVYEKLGDTRNQLRIYSQFIGKYGSDPEQSGRVIEALAKTAEVERLARDLRKAKRTWQTIIDEYNRRGLGPDAFERKYAAEAAFRLVELDFDDYRAIKLKGSLRNQGQAIKALQRQLPLLKNRYADVTKYKSFDWTLAAFYRVGQLYQLFAGALYEAPIPGGFNAEEEDLYRTQLEDIAIPLEDEAVKNYELAFEKAREFKVVNEWTKKILQALNKYKPADYPLFKEERRMKSLQQFTPPQLLSAPQPELEGEAEPAVKAASPQADAPDSDDGEAQP